MQNTESLKLLFVINPISGGKEKHDWEASIREYFRDSPHNSEFFLLSGKDDKASIRHHIDSVKPDRVVAVGGDGTVKLLAGLLKETEIVLGIIPAGSANGMAKELGIPADVKAALDIVLNGVVRKVDLIRINEEELCIHLSDLGLNAMLVKYFEHSKSRGMWGYGKAVFRMLWQKQKMQCTIITDSGTVKRHAFMVALANARKYGTGANINPDGNVSDGKFEVVIVRRLNVFEIMKSIFTNLSFNRDRIEVFSTKDLKLSVKRKAYFQVDGEYKGRVTEVHARILPGILNMVTPAAD
jgi:diacylglycerol kinase (ATP)